MGGLAVVGLGPLLFQSDQEQHYPRSGALALRKGGGVWLSLVRLRGGGGRCRLHRLLSWRRLRVTRSRCGARALWQDVSYGLRQLLCFCEALSKTCYCASKEAVGAHRGIKEGDLVCVLDFRQHEPQVALEHHQAGHGPTHCLGGGLGGTQCQVCCTSQLPESHRIRLRLVHSRVEFGLIDLEDRHRVEH